MGGRNPAALGEAATRASKVQGLRGSKAYERYTDLIGDAMASELVIDLRPGAWTFSVSAVGWTATCDHRLTAGQQHHINFTHGASGCSRTPAF